MSTNEKLIALSNLLASLTDEEMRLATDVVRTEMDVRRTRRAATLALRPGVKVKFTARGALQVGTVEKVNPKTVKVRVVNGASNVLWTVGPSLLSRVEE